MHAKSTGQMFEKIYKLTLDATKTIKNYRLWVKTILKLGNLYYNIGEYGKLNSVLSELRKAHEASKQGANVGSADTQSGNDVIHPDKWQHCLRNACLACIRLRKTTLS